VDRPVRAVEHLSDGGPVVEVDYHRRGAAGRDRARLGVVADKRGHLVAVLLQFGQYVRSDEPVRTGERYFHGRSLLPFEDGTYDHASLSFTTSTVRGRHLIQAIPSRPLDACYGGAMTGTVKL
jgi:hypothetical protein